MISFYTVELKVDGARIVGDAYDQRVRHIALKSRKKKTNQRHKKVVINRRKCLLRTIGPVCLSGPRDKETCS